jgi:serine/threonine protein kinase
MNKNDISDSERQKLQPLSASLAERYKVIEEINSGGMGTILKALDTQLGRLVAVKVISSKIATRDLLLRFQQEATVASNLNHDNLVKIYDFGVDTDSRPYMVMEFVGGDSLNAVIEERGCLRLDQVVDVLLPVCDGMSHAHSRGVIHRDLKPANIMVDGFGSENPSVKIVDFGIAKVERDDKKFLTGTAGGVLGSPAYMSPEQLKSSKLDARSDIYSLGCVLFHMLTGGPPFRGSTILETIEMHLNSALPSLTEYDFDYPIELETLLASMLAKDPANRPDSMLEVRNALVTILELSILSSASNLPVSSASVLTTSPANKYQNRRRALYYCGAFAALVGLVLGVPNCHQKRISDGKVTDYLKKSVEIDSGKDELLHQFLHAETNGILRKVTENISVSERGSNGLQYYKAFQPATDEDLIALRKEKDVRALMIEQAHVTHKGLNYLIAQPLEELSLSGTPVDDKGMITIGKMSKLRTLNLSYYSAPESSLSHLRDLSLWHLTLRHSNLSNQALERISQIQSLETLDLSYSNISKSGIKVLSRLSNLSSLRIEGCEKVWRELSALPQDFNLLDLSDCGLTDKDMSFLSSMKIRKLYLDKNKVTLEGLKRLSSCKTLMFVSAKDCSINDRDVQYLRSIMPNCSVDIFK